MIRRILISLSMLILLAHPVTSLAASEETQRAVDNDAPFWSGSDSCGPGGGTSTGISSAEALAALAKVPQVWRDLISAAAPQHPTSDPRLVAATLWVENRGWPEYKTTGWGVSDTASAKGPWQFIDSSWASMGQDGNGDGVKNVNDPADAVHGAFVHQEGSAGKPMANNGYDSGKTAEENFQTIVFERNGNNLLSFISAYNGGPDSAPANGTLFKDFVTGRENHDYIIMAYWLLATDFSTGYKPSTNEFLDATTTVATGSASGSIAQSGLCESNGSIGTANAQGYAWPVAPQKKSENGSAAGGSTLPCRAAHCHHDNTPAFDLSKKPGGDAGTGTPVYAIVDSEVDYVEDNYYGIAGCFTISLKGTQQAGGGKALDNFYYSNLHLRNPKVTDGQRIRAGTQIAEIGERKCTGNNSDPHLHIDRGCIINNVPQRGGRDECRDPQFVALINAIFEGLPE